MPTVQDELSAKLEQRKTWHWVARLVYFLLPCRLVTHDWCRSYGFVMCARCGKSDRDHIITEQLSRLNGRGRGD